MQYGIKSRPYLVFLHFGAEKGSPGSWSNTELSEYQPVFW